MDPLRFDTLARSLHDLRSRRGALGALLGSTLGLVGLRETAGKKKKKKKKKGRAPVSPPPASCPDGQRLCRGACLSVLICCTNDDCAGGRTCQAGTCACPADKPHVCAGSTICQQCCVKADCTSITISGPGVSECVGGVCTCAQPGTRYCPTHLGRCGICCDNAECTNGEVCYSLSGDSPPACGCSPSQDQCTAAGRTGCISDVCKFALNGCDAPCNPQNATPCPCGAELVCDFDLQNQEDGYRCRARSAG